MSGCPGGGYPIADQGESGDCHYLDRVLDALRSGGGRIDPAHPAHLSPLGWDHINLTGDYVWSDSSDRGPDGFLPLRINAEPSYRESVPQ